MTACNTVIQNLLNMHYNNVLFLHYYLTFFDISKLLRQQVSQFHQISNAVDQKTYTNIIRISHLSNRADGIFWSQGGLFTQYWGSAEVLQKQSSESQKFLSVLVSSDSFFFLHIIFKNNNWVTNGFNVYVNDCTIFL